MLRLAGRVHGARQGRTRTLLLTPCSATRSSITRRIRDSGSERRAISWRPAEARNGSGGPPRPLRELVSEPRDGRRLSSSSGSRLALASFEWQYELTSRLARPWERYIASSQGDARGGPSRATFTDVSRRVGINYAYREGGDAAGNLYLVGSTSFKTPTLDQLYDSRRTPVGDDVFITISNPALQPQRAREIEAGIFQRLPMGRSSLELSLSAYLRDLEDEIDFDLATFRYGNIKRSRHEALELQTLGHLWRDVELRNALTFGRALFRAGPYQGNQLKNLPQFSTQTALSVPLPSELILTFAHSATSRSWLDDENTAQVLGVHLFNAGLRRVSGPIEISFRVENLADKRGAGFGFSCSTRARCKRAHALSRGRSRDSLAIR